MRSVVNNPIFDRQIGQWVSEKVEPQWQPGDRCVGVYQDGRLTAGVLFNEWNGSNVHVHLRADTRYSMTRGFLRELFTWAFKVLGARRVTAVCDGANKRILQVTSKMGFICEAILKDFIPTGNLYVMVMWPQNCRYLEKNHG